MNVIASKAVAFGECLKPEFKDYAKKVKANAKILAKTLSDLGVKIISGGTDCHLLIVDVFEKFGITGWEAEKILDHIGITCNKNAIPFDSLSFKETSGIRLGTPAATTRGFDEDDFKKIGEIIFEILKEQSEIKKSKGFVCFDAECNKEAFKKVQLLCSKFYKD